MKTTTLAELNRPVMFKIIDQKTKIVGRSKTLDAGTRVYVERETKYGFVVRVCGTLLEQTIPFNAFTVVEIRQA